MSKHSNYIDKAIKSMEKENTLEAIKNYSLALKCAPKHKINDLKCTIATLINLYDGEEKELRETLKDIKNETKTSKIQRIKN